MHLREKGEPLIMSIPYRTRKALRRIFLGLVVLVLFSILLLVCWFLWLNRYVVYSRDGAKLDFSLSVKYEPGETAQEPEQASPPEIHDRAESDVSDGGTPFAQFSGYYVTLEELTNDFAATQQKLSALPKGSTIMLQLKDLRGLVYYTSNVADMPTGFDVTLVDGLLEDLIFNGHYVIVQIPAFQEYYYIMENERERVPHGLAKAGGGGSLWLDTSGSAPCYWLDPTTDGTMTYLIQLVTELRSKGISEVVFSDFRFPDTTSVVFDGDRLAALVSCSSTLVKTCATDSFAVSFTRSGADLTLPEGRTRLYLSGVSASGIEDAAAAVSFPDVAAQLVFLTDSGDPRFDNYSALRPLESVQ